MNTHRLLLPLLLIALTGACASARGSAARTDGAAAGDSANVLRIDQLTITTDNTELEVAFYQNVFGLRFKKLQVNATYIYSAKAFGLDLVIIPLADGEHLSDGPRYELNIIVPSVDEATKHAVNTGGTMLKAPHNGDTERSATVSDPNGNRLVLVQKL